MTEIILSSLCGREFLKEIEFFKEIIQMKWIKWLQQNNLQQSSPSKTKSILARRLSGPAVHVSPVCLGPEPRWNDHKAPPSDEMLQPYWRCVPNTTEQTRDTRRCRAVTQTRRLKWTLLFALQRSSNVAFKASFARMRAAAGWRGRGKNAGGSLYLGDRVGLEIFWLSRHHPSHTAPLKCCLVETT